MLAMAETLTGNEVLEGIAAFRRGLRSAVKKPDCPHWLAWIH